MQFAEKKPLQNDLLWLVKLFAVDFVKSKCVNILLKSCLIFHVVITIIQIYFHIYVLHSEDFIKFSPLFFATFQIILSITYLLRDGDKLEYILQEFKPWALDSAGTKIMENIKRESTYTSIFVVVNLIFALLTATFYFIPFDKDEEIFFASYFFQNCLPSYGNVLDWMYRSTFFVIGVVMVTCNYQFIYIVQHAKFQLSLLWHYAKNITNLNEYNQVIDCRLIENTDFQGKVEQRLKFCINRHVELLHGAAYGMQMMQKWIPWFAASAIFLFVSCLLFYFTNNLDMKGGYYRFGTLGFVAMIVFCGTMFLGQSIENETDVLLNINLPTRWCSLNKKNLNTFMMVTLNVKRPYRIEFTRNVSVNYKLGIQIVKLVYSALCFFLRLENMLN